MPHYTPDEMRGMNDYVFCKALDITGLTVELGVPWLMGGTEFGGGDMPPVSVRVHLNRLLGLSIAEDVAVRRWAADKMHLPTSRVRIGDEPWSDVAFAGWPVEWPRAEITRLEGVVASSPGHHPAYEELNALRRELARRPQPATGTSEAEAELSRTATPPDRSA